MHFSWSWSWPRYPWGPDSSPGCGATSSCWLRPVPPGPIPGPAWGSCRTRSEWPPPRRASTCPGRAASGRIRGLSWFQKEEKEINCCCYQVYVYNYNISSNCVFALLSVKAQVCFAAHSSSVSQITSRIKCVFAEFKNTVGCRVATAKSPHALSVSRYMAKGKNPM